MDAICLTLSIACLAFHSEGVERVGHDGSRFVVVV